MAAHTLAIITQVLDATRPIDESTCEQIEFACGHAKGMDVPCISQLDWAVVYHCAKARASLALKAALESVHSRVGYQAAYRNAEHLNRAYALYAAGDIPKILTRATTWENLPQDVHLDLAQRSEEAAAR